MTRQVEVDGVLWPDGSIGIDVDGKPWRLVFVASTWGPAHDAWFWQEFGLPVEHVLGSPAVKLPLTRIWPIESTADTAAFAQLLEENTDPAYREVVDGGDPPAKPAKRRAS